MTKSLSRFELIARGSVAPSYTASADQISLVEHPFEARNIHPKFPAKVKKLFDDGHYPEAVFAAFKFIDREVARLANLDKSGLKLMMEAFSEEKPIIALTNLATISERDEQSGFKFLFAGGMMAIRNPEGHEYATTKSPDECLDHLAFASLLVRRIEAAGYQVKSAK
jgi:uncharacterized protein (TIGR02391 family)